MNRFTKRRNDELVIAYKKHKNINIVAAMFEIKPATVRNILQARGVSMRPPKGEDPEFVKIVRKYTTKPSKPEPIKKYSSEWTEQQWRVAHEKDYRATIMA